MQVTKINYGLTVKIGDDYHKAHLEADLFPGDDYSKAKSELMAEVAAMVKAIDGAVVTTEPTSPEETPEKKTRAKRGTAKKEDDKPVEKKTRSRAKKVVVYDRDNKDHKKELSATLHEVAPGWNKDADLKAKAGELSKSLVGSDLLGTDGNVLDSFKDAVKEGMVGEGDGL